MARTPDAIPARSVVRRLVQVASPPWARLAGAVGLGVAGALATVGILAGSGYVVDRAAFRPGLGAIAGLLAAVEVLAFVRGPLRYGERLAAHDAAFRSLAHWRVWLYDRLEPLAPAGLRGWRSGDVLARVTGDVDTLQDLFVRCLLPVVVTAAAAVLAVALVAAILPAAGLVLAVCLAVALTATPLVAVHTGTARGREAAIRGELSAEVVDLLRAAPDLLAYGAEAAALDRIDAMDGELTRLARRRAWASGAAAALITACLGGAVVGVLVVGIPAVGHHHMGAVMLGVLPLAAVGAFETVPAVAQAALRACDVVAAGRRLLAIDAVPAPVTDPPRPDALPEAPLDVRVADAHLRYGPDLPFALDGLELRIGPAEQVGLVGSSGAGKTSLVHALLRFWPLQAGSASLGGVDLSRLRQRDVRRAVSLVDQEAHLFGGTIRSNVTLGRPKATDPEIADALRRAQLDGWVGTLPEGLETPVGEGGVQVSGGQRRRIALARALLAGGSLLVLDEPTAGLDASAGAQLVEDVSRQARATGTSVLLVTHREPEAAVLDRVVELEGGRAVVERPAATR